jgi:SAM-dependent methyltransferase
MGEEREQETENNQTTGNGQWDGIFREKGRVFHEIQENMPEIIELLKEKGARRVLDLGCGTGRHSVYLAENGMQVSGIDASPEGVSVTSEQMASKDLNGDFRIGNIYDKLPYPDGSFDAIISTQTLHHNKIEEIRKLIKEMERVLTADGSIFITVAARTQRHDEYTYPDKKIAPRTFVPLKGGEAGLIHYYFEEKGLKKEFGNFKTRIWKGSDGRHLCLFGERKSQQQGK